MIITMWTVLVTFFVVRHLLSERLLAFLTHECHFHGLCELVCLILGVAFGAIVPLLTTRRANSNLCVENVFAVQLQYQTEMKLASFPKSHHILHDRKEANTGIE